jgi:hypothetical protein
LGKSGLLAWAEAEFVELGLKTLERGQQSGKVKIAVCVVSRTGFVADLKPMQLLDLICQPRCVRLVHKASCVLAAEMPCQNVIGIALLEFLASLGVAVSASWLCVLVVPSEPGPLGASELCA